MAKFAVLDGINIINTISAESLEIAEEVTGKTCIEYTIEPAEPGGTYENGKFLRKKPFPSWVLQSDTWIAPIEKPIDAKGYVWDESSGNWVEVIE